MIKRLPLALALMIGLVPWRVALAQEAIPAPAAAAPTVVSTDKPVADAKPKSADDAWADVQKVHEAVEQAQSKEDAEKGLRDGLATTESFVKAYPNDPRHWDAKLLGMGLKLELSGITGAGPKAAVPDPKELEAVQAAPDATPDAKGEAAYLGLMSKAITNVDPAKPETIIAFHKDINTFMEKNATHPRATEVAQMQLQLLRMAETPDADEILKRLSASANPQVAEAAKSAAAQRETTAKLKKAPVELKFTANDGAEIDLAKMRGKVVLVDFWASWCGPCMAEAPNVVKTYKDLHPKGFDIIGISLDEDKDAMQGAEKKQGFTWPQYFDGGGWENKISKSFGIDSIPATWLIDKKGMLRETSARGEALSAAVEKLLAE